MGYSMRYLRNIVRTTASSTIIEFGLIGTFLAIAGASACIAASEESPSLFVAAAKGL